MKLEVGMYVRTDEGIAKVINKRKNPYGEETIFIIDKPFMYHFTDFLRTAEDMIDVNFEEDTSQIKGASHNIIDLIEVGDYVNGFRVDEIGEYHSIRTDKVETYAKVNCSALLNCFYEEDIKSIVTKEQFKSVSYKVGE